MTVTRRRFLQATTAASAATILGHTTAQAADPTPTLEALDAAAARPVLRRELFHFCTTFYPSALTSRK